MVFMSLIVGFLACTTPPASPTPPSPPAEPAAKVEVWPHGEAPLKSPDFTFPPNFGVHRLFVDPGHGAQGNVGNISVKCEKEMDFTMRVGARLAKDLERTGYFEALLSRGPEELVGYGDRVRAAAADKAEVFISLHSDNRGQGQVVGSADGRDCVRRDGAEGFAVLYSDEGEAELAQARHRLAVAMGHQLLEAGFAAYRGEDYENLYDEHPNQKGVFVDRHEPRKRILVLRRPTMPSVIIETHHSWHPQEVARWEEDRTLQVFSNAVVAALIEVLNEPAGAATASPL